MRWLLLQRILSCACFGAFVMTAPGIAEAQDEETGVCETGLTTGDPGTDACLTETCCAPLDTCNADAGCQACLVGEGTACNDNGAYQKWLTCSESSCASDICGSGVSFYAGNGAVEYACNACASQCCACISGCIGSGTSDELDLCLTCVVDPETCAEPSVAEWARHFRACSDALCEEECGAFGPSGGEAGVCEEPGDGGGGAEPSAGGGGTATTPVGDGGGSTCSCTSPGDRGGLAWGWLASALGVGLGLRRRSR